MRVIRVSRSGYDEFLALEVLNVVDCFEQRTRVESPASESAPHAVAAAQSLRVCMCICCGVSGKLHQTGFLYTRADKYIHGDRCY